MQEACDRFLLYQKANGNSPRTLIYYRDVIGGFLRFLMAHGHGTALSDLTVATARQWQTAMRDRGLSQKTIQSWSVGLKVWAKWLHEEGLLDRNPLARLKRPRADDVAKDSLSPDEVKTLLAACDRDTTMGARDYALLLLLYSTALRSTEARQITRGDLNRRTGSLQVRRGKGGKVRTVPLTPAVAQAIDHYLTFHGAGEALFLTRYGTPLTQEGFRQIFRRLEVATGIRCNPHKWRHSSAIQYLRNGGRVEVLQRLLGHSTLHMTLQYARQVGADVLNGHKTADPVTALQLTD